MDWAGVALFMASTSFLQFSLANLHRPLGWILLGFTVLSIWLFIRTESTVTHPLVPLRLFRNRVFSRNMIAGLAYWVLMMFPAFLIPFYLREELHLPIGWIGLSLVPQALAMIIVSPWGGRMADQYGVLRPGRIGLGVFLVTDLAFVLLPSHPPLAIIWGLLALIGIGAGLFSSPQNSSILNTVTKPDMGLASSLLATQRNMGRAIGVAFASIILSLVWMSYGLGPTPAHNNPLYPHWFLLGFRGVFLSGVLFAILGFLTFTAPEGHPDTYSPKGGQ